MDRAEPDKVLGIFEQIAEGYDRGNDRISMGMHRLWKRALVKEIAAFTGGQGKVLDLCCGTGDICRLLAEQPPGIQVTGVDFSPAMLRQARRRTRQYPQVELVRADATRLPFADGSFSGAVISFGLRNTPDYEAVLREMARVVEPGGMVWCLEASMPEGPLINRAFRLYFSKVMPLLGGVGEYRWLYQSTEGFLKKRDLAALFRQTGLEQTGWREFAFGTCALHRGRKG